MSVISKATYRFSTKLFKHLVENNSEFNNLSNEVSEIITDLDLVSYYETMAMPMTTAPVRKSPHQMTVYAKSSY
jgi:hypothetical protein